MTPEEHNSFPNGRFAEPADQTGNNVKERSEIVHHAGESPADSRESTGTNLAAGLKPTRYFKCAAFGDIYKFEPNENQGLRFFSESREWADVPMWSLWEMPTIDAVEIPESEALAIINNSISAEPRSTPALIGANGDIAGANGSAESNLQTGGGVGQARSTECACKPACLQTFKRSIKFAAIYIGFSIAVWFAAGWAIKWVFDVACK